METRVYAIKETEDVHEISNEDFMNQAEDLGYVWSLNGFQNEMNCEGSPSLSISDFKDLHFRFIDVPTEKNELSDEKYKCSECSESFIKDGRESYDVFENCICYDCVIQTHCFCEECDELVPTSHCTMEDGIVHEVDGLSVDESRVICNVCDENKDEIPSIGKINDLLDSATRPMEERK